MQLADLIALNDEIAALARAGVPIERGLFDFGRDLRGRLGNVARDVGRHLESGLTLQESLARVGPGLPPTYCAVVESGIRAGRLPAALEDVASYARAFADLRRVIGQALVYPTIVLLMAYGLLIGFLVVLIPRIRQAFESFGVASSGFVTFLDRAGETAIYWGPIVPLVVGLLIVCWIGMGRARGLDTTRALRWVPWLRGVVDDWRSANFTGWLSMMVRHGVPLDQGLELAGRASGDRRLATAAFRAADLTRKGATPDVAIGQPGTLPPLARWTLLTARDQESLANSLGVAADRYRRRAMRQADVMRILSPPLLLLFIGGAGVLIYTVTLFLPWAGLLRALAGADQ